MMVKHIKKVIPPPAEFEFWLYCAFIDYCGSKRLLRID